MEYSFTAWGHKNITGKHKRTLEFIKDSELSLEGDCIIGVCSNFSIYDLKELVTSSKKLKMIIKVDDISDEVVFEVNPEFNDESEIVVRKSDFISDRTFGINADKAGSDLKKELIEKLNDDKKKIEVIIKDAYPQHQTD